MTGREEHNETWAYFQVELSQVRDAVLAGDLKRRFVPKAHDAGASAAGRNINDILDTIIQTFECAVTSVDGMCTGRIPEPFKDGFPGDFARAKNVCNDFIDVINRRNAQIAKMTQAAGRGDLHVRAKP